MFAVITGDIVDSTTRYQPDPQVFSEIDRILTSVFTHMHEKGWMRKGDYMVYRGDSFQCLLPVEKGMQGILMIKAALKGGMEVDSHNTQLSWGCRLAVGIGEVTYRADHISKSNGPAFQRSGRKLDAMLKDHFTEIKTPWEQANEELDLTCRYLDIVIERLWTVNSARTAWMYFRDDYTQQELADQFGITQSAMNQRIQGAELAVLEQTIQRYQNIIKNHIP